MPRRIGWKYSSRAAIAVAAMFYVIAVTAPAGRASAASRAAVVNATFSYPRDGQAAVVATTPLAWTPILSAQAYILAVGTTRFGTDVALSPVLPPTQTSYQVAALATGRPLYATVLTEIGGIWGYNAVIFFAAPGDTLTYPTDHQANVNQGTLTWTAVPESQGAILAIGSTRFGTDLWITGLMPPGQTSTEVVPLPAGKILYATLLTKTNGGYSRYQTIGFTAAATTAPALVTFVNTYFAAVHVSLEGHEVTLSPGQHVGPVPIVPSRTGNDIVMVSALSDRGCGLGTAGWYLHAGRSARFTVNTNGGRCANGTVGPNFTVTET